MTSTVAAPVVRQARFTATRRIAVRPFTRLTFALFVFWMPLEAAKLPGMPATLSFAKIFGYLFFIAALTQPRLVFRRPRTPVVLFGCYAAAVALLLAVQPAPGGLPYLLQLVQWLALLWAASNILAFRSIRGTTLLMITAGTTVLAGVQALAPVIGSDERLSALSENPNTVGALCALAIIAALGWRREYSHDRSFTRLLVIAGIVLLTMQLVRTGSRGSMLAVVIGLFVFVVVAQRFAGKMKMAAMAIVVLSGLAAIVITSDTVRARWQMAIQSGDFSKREQIFPESLAMIAERPIAGWGPQHHLFELGRRFGMPSMEEHNLMLFVLAEGGMLTGLAYALGLFVTMVYAFRARRAGAGITAVALFMALMTVNVSNVFQNRKTHWLILGFAIAAASTPRRPRPPQRRRLVQVRLDRAITSGATPLSRELVRRPMQEPAR